MVQSDDGHNGEVFDVPGFVVVIAFVGCPFYSLVTSLFRESTVPIDFVVATLGFLCPFVCYLLVNTYMQYTYYRGSAGDVKLWKSQPDKKGNVGNSSKWWFPLLGAPPKGKADNHRLFTTTYVTIYCGLCALVCTLAVRGNTLLLWENDEAWGWWGGLRSPGWTPMGVLCDVALLFTYFSICEYYLHRVMHRPYFYKRVHKVHHHYLTPEPFDDFYVHPGEALSFNMMMFAPCCMFPVTVPGYAIYLLINFIQEHLDHCGVRVVVGGLYNAEHHDSHHRMFDVNFGSPLPVLDILHGTFNGVFLGYRGTYKDKKATKKLC